MVIAALALVQQAPIDFKLNWKKEQSFAYALNVDSPIIKSEGRWQAKVSAIDEKGLTVSWPEVAMSNGMRPIPAGSQKVTPRGVLVGTINDQGGLFMIAMALPDKPVLPGATYTVKYEGRIDLTFTFAKIDGRKAHFTSIGKHAASGGGLEVKTESVYDIDRGVFLSGNTSMGPTSTFSFKLAE
jgi:hypothetical protein